MEPNLIPLRAPVTLTSRRHTQIFEKCRARWPDFALHRKAFRSGPQGRPRAEWAVIATCTVRGKPYELSVFETPGVDTVLMVLVGALSSDP